jgi:hypothetical protein
MVRYFKGARRRMLPRVSGSPAGDRGRVLMPARIPWPLSAKAVAIADMVSCLLMTRCGLGAKKDDAAQQGRARQNGNYGILNRERIALTAP